MGKSKRKYEKPTVVDFDSGGSFTATGACTRGSGDFDFCRLGSNAGICITGQGASFPCRNGQNAGWGCNNGNSATLTCGNGPSGPTVCFFGPGI